ncbi:chaperonin 10-like protein [Apiospora saccharicola]|uniref:Chaperonin 10-like protein n=1 Tax=Apiospora saccharicola TaxID=335842 RepID=A0ABR1U3D0_9PEZI
MTSTDDVKVPKTHKACVYDNPGSCSIAVRVVETPEPGPGEVLVKLTHSGICHSDYGVMMNTWAHLPFPTQQGQVGGHEGVGFVAKVGDGTGSAGVKVGDRVGIKWVSSACLACPPCLEGMDGVCFNQKISGYFTPGTFQQYVIGPANYVTPVPESLPGDLAAPMLCAGVTTYAALRKSGANSGHWVVIAGAGGGLGTVAVSLGAKVMGYRVIGVDAPSKKDIVLDSGAEHFIDVTAHDDDSIAAEVKKLTGHGAKAVIVCTSSNKAYGQALGMLGFGGTVVCVGMPEGDPQPIARSYPAVMVAKQASIVASAVGNRREAAEVLGFATRGLVKFPVRTVGMDELQSVFESMGRGEISGRVVLDLSK